ncbi:esterase/lipase family protein [Xylophilus sp. GOD-11R]|uniref:esterase/lipase family protein n=1 Tax=Xylophilus sp. GOD-11R TaxID=3089814 RepID=UPI00298D4945|nr:alpha/beta fold hydrolase [Xylophilus sp. GOD-11R]WPB56363.1 alpha/beta fold hydrolase [Xylophilus sp. GOD-11R]
MLARLQQRITLTLLVAALAWVCWWWRSQPAVAVGGVAVLLFGHAFFLGLEMLAMGRVNRADPAPRASAVQVLAAWWQECFAAVGVFCWRQPFFSNAVPDHLPTDAAGRQGVVLIHGFVCNRGFWTPWLRRLRERDLPFVAVNLEPVVAHIEAYRAIVDAAVARVTAATGRPPVLLCHSMGGLVARDWIRSGSHHGRVARVVTIASPHHGTWLGRFAREASGLQMRQGGAWLAALADGEDAALRSRFQCWYSNCDNVVFPASTACLEGAENRFVAGLPHVALAFEHSLMTAVVAELEEKRVESGLLDRQNI